MMASSRNPRGQRRPQDGRHNRTKGGRGVNRNPNRCPGGGPGYGGGGGQGGGGNRR